VIYNTGVAFLRKGIALYSKGAAPMVKFSALG
jgi:hypothetical protein